MFRLFGKVKKAEVAAHEAELASDKLRLKMRELRQQLLDETLRQATEKKKEVKNG